jgi:hypothetical protein
MSRGWRAKIQIIKNGLTVFRNYERKEISSPALPAQSFGGRKKKPFFSIPKKD